MRSEAGLDSVARTSLGAPLRSTATRAFGSLRVLPAHSTAPLAPTMQRDASLAAKRLRPAQLVVVALPQAATGRKLTIVSGLRHGLLNAGAENIYAKKF